MHHVWSLGTDTENQNYLYPHSLLYTLIWPSFSTVFINMTSFFQETQAQEMLQITLFQELPEKNI